MNNYERLRQMLQEPVSEVVESVEPKEASVPAPAAPPESAQMLYDDDQDEYVPVGIGGLLASTEKLLAVNRGLTPTDDRDSWGFKRVKTPDMLMRERVRLDAAKTRLNLLRNAARMKNLSGMHSFAFNPYTEGLLVGNSLSMPLEEINPMQLVEQSRRITMMGPGGIGSEDAITQDMQAINATQFGFISPLEGPESSRAGVDVRLSWGTKYGSDGKVYQRFLDPRKKKYVWLSPEQVIGKVVKIPD
jgi:DNA-directed RNA polymerase beta subunit